jgi:hypothetical protein
MTLLRQRTSKRAFWEAADNATHQGVTIRPERVYHDG